MGKNSSDIFRAALEGTEFLERMKKNGEIKEEKHEPSEEQKERIRRANKRIIEGQREGAQAYVNARGCRALSNDDGDAR